MALFGYDTYAPPQSRTIHLSSRPRKANDIMIPLFKVFMAPTAKEKVGEVKLGQG